jgi:hypothetical protein
MRLSACVTGLLASVAVARPLAGVKGNLKEVAKEDPQAVTGRVEVSLDFGWRFFLGGNPGGQCTSTYPNRLDNFQCYGLNEAPDGSASEAACMAAACNISAQVYQWCPGTGNCGTLSCWIGQANDCNNTAPGWVSASVNTSTPWNPAASQPSFNDASWDVIDIPHDFEITGVYNSTQNGGEGFLPYNVSFYRKHLVLDPSWQGSHVEVYIEGALSASTWWYQGVQLTSRYSGYTSAILRLDNVPGVVFGNTSVLVGYVDGTEKTGWWYEGAGLFRHAYISVMEANAHIVTHGIKAPAYIDGTIHSGATPADGLVADTVVMLPSVQVTNDLTVDTPGVSVTFQVFEADGQTLVGTVSSGTLQVNKTQTVTFETNPLTVSNVNLWSIPRPYLHTLVTSVFVGKTVVDVVNSSIGFKGVTWDPNLGLILNEQPVKMRGKTLSIYVEIFLICIP